MKNSLLLITVFICGACTMILELVGSRLLAPFFGTTLYVWAGIIGVILGFMSLGYWIGGRLADKGVDRDKLGKVIAFCSLSIALLAIIKNAVLYLVSSLPLSNTINGLLATVLLFALPSAILAMVSPIAFKLVLTDAKLVGKTSGNIYAFSTFGSIIGTFAAGFWLIPAFGNSIILSGVIFTLAILAILVCTKKITPLNVFMLATIIISCFFNLSVFSMSSQIIYEKESNYGSIWVQEFDNKRILQIDNGTESGIYLDKDDLVFDYTNAYRLADYFNQNIQNALTLGGAGYTWPTYFVNNKPNGTMDVVEIDPDVTEVAKEYFGLVLSDRLRTFHEDGRTFLNKNEKKYDAIYGDAYAGMTPPYNLSTVEAIKLIKNSLEPGGVFVSNIISAIEGKNSKFLDAYYKTVSEAFGENIFLFTCQYERRSNERQNILLFAINSEEPFEFYQTGSRIFSEYLSHNVRNIPNSSKIKALTDEHAPVEYLTAR